MSNDEFIWESSVRGYELDNQSIVNNANYLHYFNHARLICLNSLGVDWDEWHTKGYNLVLVKASLEFKAPLKAFDKFKVISTFNMAGKIRLAFKQKIYKISTNLLCANAETISVCVSIKSGKPIYQQDIYKKIFASRLKEK